MTKDDFFIFILSRFCKNIWSATNFAKIYICVVAIGARPLMSWPIAVGAARSGPLAWPRRGVVGHGARGLAPRATAAAGLLAPWATALGSDCLYNTEIQPKMS
jgi:hypothetical protein